MTTAPPVQGTLLTDILLWMRRIIKATSDNSISDDVLITYVNRFMYEIPERIQVFDYKRQYTFETQKNRFMYQFPYQDYQGLQPPAYCDGLQLGFYLSNDQFYKVYPELVLNENPLNGDGTPGPYAINFGRRPILRGFTDDQNNLLPFVFVTATTAGGIQQYAVDDGNGILINVNANLQPIDGLGNLIPTETQLSPIPLGVVDYDAGTASVTFLANIPVNNPINCQTSPFSSGQPRIALFFDNYIKLYPVPDKAYKIQFDAHITPAQFLNNQASYPFFYMSEYIARGAARKILTDTLDEKQFNFYEMLFNEQERLVLRRTSRQMQKTRAATIFSAQTSTNPWLYTQY